ncbi:uncharacterized protein K444DRAFT_276796 [Hyaloscypha bicolor E]|uniref:Uncharacterized protein n=1 Tax=Hyaloscypha bicolor E TaxID=1095630 RepID=A0A2J6SJ44_9HELO|nr:uncharacterized protein K444DRAFT_276796 [Hyaloscypha bicolor E]PMD50792.1 hypothetical protein K444DRAFT_276796 [Hyaloscypha bicolor E]
MEMVYFPSYHYSKFGALYTQVHKQVYLNSFTNSSQTPQTLSPVPLSFSRFKSDQYTLSGSGVARCLEEEAISGGFYVRKVGEIHHDVEDGSSTFGGRGRKREGSGRVRVGFLDGGDGRFGGRDGLRGCVGVSVEAVERCAVERQMPAKSDTRK